MRKNISGRREGQCQGPEAKKSSGLEEQQGGFGTRVGPVEGDKG